MPNWEELNAQKRLQEERAKHGISGPMAQPRPGGSMAQWATPDPPRRSTSLSDHQPSHTQPLTGDVGPVGHRPATDSVGHRPRKDTRVRPHLDIRLPNGSLDVERIVANWTAEKKAAPNVAAAIRLMDAMLTGNLDYVRENYPAIVEGLQKSQKRRATLSLKESDSYTERESAKSEERNIEPAVEQIAEALQQITSRDRHLNRDVNELALDLHKANYTAQDVEAWYQRCWPHDWRAVKAAQERRVEQPSLKIIRECIGQVRSLPVDEPELVEEDWNPFTPPADEPVEAWPPQACTVPQHILTWWASAKDQFSVQLNRATFDTWLKPTTPVHFVGDPRAGGTLYVAVPHHYGKEWIDRHLLTALNKTFDDLLNYDNQTRRRISEPPLFDVQIIVEGDPVPGVSDA